MKPAAIRTTVGLFSIFPSLLACGRADLGSSDAQPTIAATATDPAERGRYLVDGLLRCMYCHSQRDLDQPGAPVADPVGAGVILREEGEYRIVASNITPDDQTGIGLRTDEQLARAIRQGIGHDGRPLAVNGRHNEYAHLSDEAVGAVIAYLRALEPVNNPLPPTVPPPGMQEQLDERAPIALDPIPLNRSDPIEQGRALARFARCQGCHTSWYSERNPGVFAGGNLIEGERDSLFSTNITPDASGVRWDAEAFIEVMRTGKNEGLHPYMPWVMFRNLSDADLRAIHAFLQTMQPVAHYINNYAAPTYCPVCGQEHGLGAMNRLEPPVEIRLEPAQLERYMGTYYNADDDFRFEIRVSGDRLVARAYDMPSRSVILLSETRILLEGDTDPLDVTFGSDGRAEALTSVDQYADVYARVDGGI